MHSATGVTVTEKAALLHGVKLEGVAERPLQQDQAEFLQCSNLINAGLPLVATPSIQQQVLQIHKQGLRCYVHVKLTFSPQEYAPGGASVIPQSDGKDLFSKDSRFESYVKSYDPSYMLPVYIESTNNNSFHAGVIGQPWILLADQHPAPQQK